jgi:hypothetical protein
MGQAGICDLGRDESGWDVSRELEAGKVGQTEPIYEFPTIRCQDSAQFSGSFHGS